MQLLVSPGGGNISQRLREATPVSGSHDAAVEVAQEVLPRHGPSFLPLPTVVRSNGNPYVSRTWPHCAPATLHFHLAVSSADFSRPDQMDRFRSLIIRSRASSLLRRRACTSSPLKRAQESRSERLGRKQQKTMQIETSASEAADSSRAKSQVRS